MTDTVPAFSEEILNGDKPFSGWDFDKIVQAYADELSDGGWEDYAAEEEWDECPDDSDLWNWAYEHTDSEHEWECMVDDLTEQIEARNPEGKWVGFVNNFGWRHLDGFSRFHATDGKAFLSEILPKTNCTFKVFFLGKHGFKIDNAHHDVPMGGEIYQIVPFPPDDDISVDWFEDEPNIFSVNLSAFWGTSDFFRIIPSINEMKWVLPICQRVWHDQDNDYLSVRIGKVEGKDAGDLREMVETAYGAIILKAMGISEE